MSLKKCKECGKDISTEAESCPKCGAVFKKKPGFLDRLGVAILVFIGIGMIASLMNMGSKEPTSSSSSAGSSAASTAVDPAESNSSVPSGFERIECRHEDGDSLVTYETHELFLRTQRELNPDPTNCSFRIAMTAEVRAYYEAAVREEMEQNPLHRSPQEQQEHIKFLRREYHYPTFK